MNRKRGEPSAWRYSLLVAVLCAIGLAMTGSTAGAGAPSRPGRGAAFTVTGAQKERQHNAQAKLGGSHDSVDLTRNADIPRLRPGRPGVGTSYLYGSAGDSVPV